MNDVVQFPKGGEYAVQAMKKYGSTPEELAKSSEFLKGDGTAIMEACKEYGVEATAGALKLIDTISKSILHSLDAKTDLSKEDLVDMAQVKVILDELAKYTGNTDRTTKIEVS